MGPIDGSSPGVDVPRRAPDAGRAAARGGEGGAHVPRRRPPGPARPRLPATTALHQGNASAPDRERIFYARK